MFKAVGDQPCIAIVVDDQSVQVPEGISVAAALLLLAAVPFRYSAVDDSPRAPYCLMGVCAECLVTINNKPGQFACQITVQPGMVVNRLLHRGLEAVSDHSVGNHAD